MHAVALHELTPLPPLDGPCRVRAISLLFLCVHVLCLVYVSVYHMSGAHGGWKRDQNPGTGVMEGCEANCWYRGPNQVLCKSQKYT